MAEKDFIKENIVGRKEDWKKRTRHYARVLISALLFGSVSAAVFGGLEPAIRERLHPMESEAVVLETEVTACWMPEGRPILKILNSTSLRMHSSRQRMP